MALYIEQVREEACLGGCLLKLRIRSSAEKVLVLHK